MADDDAIDGQALTGGDITRYGALVVRISYLSQDRPDLKFASTRVYAQENWQVPRRQAKSEVCWFLLATEWRQSHSTVRSYLRSSREEAAVSKCGPRSSRW